MPIVLGIAALAGWGCLELVLRPPGEASSLAGSPADRFSTPLLVIGYAVAAVLPFVVGSQPPGALSWLGVGLAAIGLVLRAWSMATLGHAYTRNLRTNEAQELTTNGPYRYVRHPGYLGSILVWIGAAMAFGSWPAAALAGIVLVAAYGWRIAQEERMLGHRFGQRWQAYAARTARLPGLW
jgi:protein-S-isoprenylcysteine O-methyltransferase Ste14